LEREDYEQYEMQDALQQKQLDNQTALYAPQLQEQVQQAQAILVEQTDPKNVIRDVMFILRGVEKRDDGNFVRVTPPKMNKKGLECMWFWLKSHINQNTILSHYDDEEIRCVMNALSKDLVRELGLNWRIYGVKSKTDLNVINDCVLINIKSAFNRAKHGNEKKWLGKISVENISGGGVVKPPKKEGFFSKFRL
jgi:hypothetical protein